MARADRRPLMPSLLYILTVSTLALALAGSSIRAGDRELLVAPPEAVAENFVRAVVTGRYTPARQRLSGASPIGIPELAALRQQLETRVADVHTVDGEAQFHDHNAAVANAIVKGKLRSEVLRVQLRFESGVWKIHAWSLEPPLHTALNIEVPFV